jgi:hypothetical protein
VSPYLPKRASRGGEVLMGVVGRVCLPPVLYDYEYTTADGRRPSKIFFLCW